MTTLKFNIDTIKRADKPLVEFKKTIVFKGQGHSLEKGLNDTTIDIHEVEISDNLTPIREYCSTIDIVLDPEWVNKDSMEFLNSTIFDDEQMGDTVLLNIILICPKTKDVIALKKFKVDEIIGDKTIAFEDIELNRYYEKLEIQSNITRIIGHSAGQEFLADQKNSILSENNTISIYIDEVESPGGGHLDIRPEKIGRYLFLMNDWNTNETNAPAFLYNKDFEKFFKGGDHIQSVQLFLMMSLVIYSEDILKWVLFGEGFNKSDKYHSSILDFLLKILDLKKTEIEDLIDTEVDDEKIKRYMALSQKLKEKIQLSTVNFKNTFRNFINHELKNA